MSTSDAWCRARHILCVRLDAMGDLLMTVPAIRALREAVPGRRVTLLTSPSGAEAAALIPCVDDVIIYDAPWMKAAAPRADPGPDLAIVERLARAGLEAAAIFAVYSQNPLPSAMLCYLAGIPLRLAHCRENPYQLLTDWVPEREPQQLIRHEVRRQLDLVAAVGCRAADERMQIRIPEVARGRVDSWLGDQGLGTGTPWAVVHPGSTAASRRYPPQSYAEAATRLVRDHGVRLVFTGGASERETIQSIRLAMGGVASLSLAGELSLAELAALIGRAPLLISNNTGPVHVAASVGTPVVDLYALTNPQHTPWGVPSRVLNHDVPCKYCYKSVCPEGHHDCLRLVTPGQVVAAAIELLGLAGPMARAETTGSVA
ncbi:ADP-heptose--LPS heptosyltransferase 2 [Aquisphaera giovannonii]|uniref:ADP-heptose--LPS heptosyltransferase 2 n=1 Tax=Aquisphaera giovannonii TaxID=406548 RepID=A0A5B9W3E2_9BACT|nr:glycosyltransferase family 9 protein [Aquisphaera giovannonii]QEH34777.1 ADP-heptose--LPS heptosyltransferase 2 [Aquisphaera giovannonii]